MLLRSLENRLGQRACAAPSGNSAGSTRRSDHSAPPPSRAFRTSPASTRRTSTAIASLSHASHVPAAVASLSHARAVDTTLVARCDVTPMSLTSHARTPAYRSCFTPTIRRVRT